MAQRLKSWESPRYQGRNHKGKGRSARQRQLQKQRQRLRQKLKGVGGEVHPLIFGAETSLNCSACTSKS